MLGKGSADAVSLTHQGEEVPGSARAGCTMVVPVRQPDELKTRPSVRFSTPSGQLGMAGGVWKVGIPWSCLRGGDGALWRNWLILRKTPGLPFHRTQQHQSWFS